MVVATLSGFSQSAMQLAAVRGFWGLGSVTLYEAVLGLGIWAGPLPGGLLGRQSRRCPFFGRAARLLTFPPTLLTVREPEGREQPRTARDQRDALRTCAAHSATPAPSSPSSPIRRSA